MQLANPQEPTTTLLNHRGASTISRADLSSIPTPKPTMSHTPVSHAKLMDVIEETLSKQKLEIIEQKYSVMNEGLRLFGVLKLQGTSFDSETYRMALGIRTSNDKTIPLTMLAGANVWICDNLCFRADLITMDRKHTSRLNFREEVQTGVSRAIEGYQSIGTLVDVWKGTALSTESAKALILDAAVKGVMPLHLIPDVLKEWNEPRYKDFEPRTLWSLNNCFTEAFKQLKQHVAMESATGLARMFQEVKM